MALALIISSDNAFTSVMAEHLTRELALECKMVADAAAGEPWLKDAAIVVSDGSVQTTPPALVFSKENGPIRLQSALREIAAHLEAPAENLTLGGGYSFASRSKQLQNSAGKTAELTDREAALLIALAKAGEEGVSKDELLKEVWGFDPDINTHTLETHIYRLRSKIREVFGSEIIAATQGGYRWDV